MTDAPAADLSVVIPVYRCIGCLRTLYERLTFVLANMNVAYEIVFIDDSSPDGSWLPLREIAEQDERVLSVQLSRNYGQQAAITAGLAECTGAAAVVMDCDLQDPPEYIPDLYSKHLAGHDVVLAERNKKSHSILRQWASETFHATMKLLTGADYSGRFGTFSLLSRKAINEFLNFKDINRHYLFIIECLGYKKGIVPFEQAERSVGESSYNLWSLVKHAINGVYFHSTLMMKWIMYLGVSLAGIGVLLGLLLFFLYSIDSTLYGWRFVIVLSVVLCGLQFFALGVVGLRIAQVFDQCKSRPFFIVEERVGKRKNKKTDYTHGDDFFQTS